MRSSNEKRVFGLDLVRAIAIILVMVSHSTLLLFPNSDNTYIATIQFFGSIGVDLFFVLSGFLIGGIILRHIDAKQFRFKDLIYFWTRRWFRTLPNYFLILGINIVLLWWWVGQLDPKIAHYMLFLQNFSSPHPAFFSEAWTLSIEEMSYVLGPLFIFMVLSFTKYDKKRIGNVMGTYNEGKKHQAR